MTDYAMRVNNVSKKFCKRLRYTMLYGALDLTSTFFNVHQNFNRLRTGEFWALKDIDFEVKKGEAVGLIGANGAGKSTMLKLLNGIYMPDNGEIEVYGRVGALIQVGAGFHPMLTGRENIYVNGEILGMKKKFIDKHFDEIVDFSGIEDFIDTPVKHYSSGMFVRLGFAVVAFCQPEILLVDEVLAVGDTKFRRKCLEHLSKLQKQGVTFIIVSHNMQMLEGIALKGIFFDKGNLIHYGNIQDAISEYETLMLSQKIAEEITNFNINASSDSLKIINKWDGYSTDEIEIKYIKLKGQNNEYKKKFCSSDTVTIEAVIDSEISDTVNIRAFFRNIENVTCLGTDKICDITKGRQKIELIFNPIQITTGRYKLVFHIYPASSMTTPYTNGHYGYFDVIKQGSSYEPGKNAPYCWIDPQIKITKLT
ncbi:ATP-binding cassette domain-containing protein [bacterium]|nr:ATP-binding cassette domain-containing protein [bacterium]